jgi:hypothetical protein
MALAPDDGESVDRTFAEMMAGYHLTADRPDPLARLSEDPAGAVDRERPASVPLDKPRDDPDTSVPDRSWAESHPLFVYESAESADFEEVAETVEDRFVPEPLPPLSKPAWPVLIAWLGLGYSIVVMLAAVLGIGLPAWAGWMALAGFVGGMGLLFARLPRTRPPEAGDGAVL